MRNQSLPGANWLFLAGLTALLFLVIQLLFAQSASLAFFVQPPASVNQENVPVSTSKVTALSPSPAVQTAAVATEWFDLYLTLVKSTNGFTPPVAARAFGYAGVALYETVAPGEPSYQSLAGQLNGLGNLPRPARSRAYDWPTAANAALASMARHLFANTSAENLTAIQALEERWNQADLTALDAETHARSVQYGQQMAAALFAWSKSDGGHEGYNRNFPAEFVAATGPGQWQPTPPNFQTPLQPTWGENRPFVLATGDACPSARPLRYSESPASAFYQEGLEVYTTSQALSDEQRAIALFWSDDPGQTATPPGHSISIATQVLRQENASLLLAAETYAKVGMAVADSFIGCWNAKYEYNLLRPVTYIQTLIDPAWMPLLATPPFPEYPSGHSVQSSAVATVLTDLFGDHYALVDHTHDDRGLAPRSFSSFKALAEEAAISRLYGGIHFRRAIELGLFQGDCIGAAVNALQLRK